MSEVEKILIEFGNKVIADAKRNLASKNSSGALSSSLKVKLTGDNSLGFWMQDYGPAVDMGRDGTEQRKRNHSSVFWVGGNRGKAAPPEAIKKWMASKGIGSGKKATVKDGITYVIGEKIRKQGIKPSMFFTYAWDRHFNKLEKDIVEGFNLDLDILLEDELQNIIIK